MKRGVKPKPTHLKLIAGNPGKRPLNANEPKLLPALPDPPSHLSEHAAREWLRIGADLYKAGILTVVDRAALAAYCQAYGRWVQAEEVLAAIAARDPVTHGLTTVIGDNHPVQNPLVGLANKAMHDMVRYATEFGMTPSSRSRVQAEPRNEDKDPAAQYF